jgi:hypothetical protein
VRNSGPLPRQTKKIVSSSIMKNVKFVGQNWNIHESHWTIKYCKAQKHDSYLFLLKCEKYSNVLSK